MHFFGGDIRAVELHTGNGLRLTMPEVDDRTPITVAERVPFCGWAKTRFAALRLAELFNALLVGSPE
jgi:hypothetical protein